MKPFIRSFGISAGLSLAAVAYVAGFLGPGAVLITLILASIELAFSFDNAIINAKVLNHVSPFWQKLFLSLGIVIAIFGVRMLLPIIIVGWSAHLPMGNVIDLAFHHPEEYAKHLEAAHTTITAFGGAFLMMLVLHFFMRVREVQWLKVVERPLGKLMQWWLPLTITTAIVVGLTLSPLNHHRIATLEAGVAGVLVYTIVNGFIEIMNNLFDQNATGKRTGWAAFATFMYLELLDASLSFDGVIGAFAITSNVILIAIGLGIGAVWVRSLTIYMVHRNTLESYKYLEHGAHYAIAVLAVAMLASVIINVPDFVTGFLSLGLIASALIASRQALQKE